MKIYVVRLLSYYIGDEKLMSKLQKAAQPEGDDANEDTVS